MKHVSKFVRTHTRPLALALALDLRVIIFEPEDFFDELGRDFQSDAMVGYR